jgi:tetratricopeptide (TPR) repeat protein
LGKYQEAIKEFDKAIELNPEYTEVNTNKEEAQAYLEDKFRIRIARNGVIVPTDTPPSIIGGRVYVPLRVIAELTGAKVYWEDGTIVVKKEATTIEMHINSPEIFVNNQKILMDNIPFIMYNRTMVPLRWIATNLNIEVNWDEKNKKVILD